MTPSLSRRSLLGRSLGLGVAMAASGCAEAPPPEAAPAPPPAPPPSPIPAGLDPAHFILHSASPLTLEARREAPGAGPITPISRFFIRNNLPMPPETLVDDREGWEVEVEGVARPRRLRLAELKTLGLATLATVIQCSGNGRAFYDHSPSGSQWGVGAAGCALWTGVPLAAVVEALGGAAPAARHLTSTGADPLPEGVDPLDVIVERSIPIAKALGDALLAWEMNGEPIPLTHGGPLRLIVPGYYGCNQIKYVRRLAFTEAQTEAKIQRSGYRYRPIGAQGAPDQPSMWEMQVKSWIIGPGGEGRPVLAGRRVWHGVAFSGGSPITGVEVSLDGGATWAPAQLGGPDLGPYAWRTFTFSAALAVGSHRLCSRARDASGAEQPEQRDENERGYGHNGWRDHALSVEVVDALPAPGEAPAEAAAPPPRAPVTLDERAERGKQALLGEASPPCGACHSLADAGIQGAVGPDLDALAPTAARVEAALTNGVGVMPPYRDTLDARTLADIAHYVEQATRR